MVVPNPNPNQVLGLTLTKLGLTLTRLGLTLTLALTWSAVRITCGSRASVSAAPAGALAGAQWLHMSKSGTSCSVGDPSTPVDASARERTTRSAHSSCSRAAASRPSRHGVNGSTYAKVRSTQSCCERTAAVSAADCSRASCAADQSRSSGIRGGIVAR